MKKTLILPITTLIIITVFVIGYLKYYVMPPLLSLTTYNTLILVVYLLILEILCILVVLDLIGVSLGLAGGKGKYMDINTTKVFFISIFATLGFNFLGIIQSIIFKLPLCESVIKVTWLGFIILALSTTILHIMLFKQRLNKNQRCMQFKM